MLKIHDPQALDILEQLEGVCWRQKQNDDPSSPYGFHAYLGAWQEALKEGSELRVFVDGGDGAIYGNGGIARYIVAWDGEIILLKWSTHKDKIKKAESLGVRAR